MLRTDPKVTLNHLTALLDLQSTDRYINTDRMRTACRLIPAYSASNIFSRDEKSVESFIV